MTRSARRRTPARAIAAVSGVAALICGGCSFTSNDADQGAGTTTDLTTAAPGELATDTPATSELKPPPAAAAPLLVDRFDRPDGVVTDERTWHDDTGTSTPDDSIWAATSGVFRSTDGVGWSDSPVFRMITHRQDLGDVAVAFRLRVDGIADDGDQPESAWDGVHVLLHYQDETELYAVSVSRRDGEVAIKRKDPGGPSNGGTYSTLASGPGAVPVGTWTDVRVTIRQVEAGVELTASLDGAVILAVTDTEAVRERSARPGRIGLRADNTTFHIDDLVVEPLEG